jgi:choline dehydrogenase-like flavoprotein
MGQERFGPSLKCFGALALARVDITGAQQTRSAPLLVLVPGADVRHRPGGVGREFAKIIHSFDQDAMALWNANFEEGLKIAKATDAKEVWSGRGNMPTIHLMGGTIMGTEAGNSVTNSYGQTHEVSNLYVAGPGIFATAGASNPTYTILALSLRGAEHLVGNWNAVAG